MLLNLLLANITIRLCFFFLFHVVFNIFVTMPVDIVNAKFKDAPITVPNDAIEMLPLVPDKTIKDLSK